MSPGDDSDDGGHVIDGVLFVKQQNILQCHGCPQPATFISLLLDAGRHLHHVAKHCGEVVLCHLVPREIPKVGRVGVGRQVAQAVQVSWEAKIEVYLNLVSRVVAQPCLLYLCANYF